MPTSENKDKENEEVAYLSKQIDKLYNSLTNIVGIKKLTVGDFMDIATKLMQIVEKYPELNGIQKKKVIICAFKQFFEKNKDGYEDSMISFAMSMLPNIIDIVISVDKKKLNIHIRKVAKKIFSCC